MTPPMDTSMMEATRLTREGRLADAMAVIQSALSGAPRPGSSEGIAGNPLSDPEKEAGRLIDMAPPSATTGASWTALRPTEANSSGRHLARDWQRAPGTGLGSPSRPGNTPLAAEGLVLNRAAGRSVAVRVPWGARWEERVYASAAGSRSYKLYVPSGYEGRATGLVVMLHGCTQSPDDFAVGTKMNDLAEEKGLLVAYPAQCPTANVSKCWNWFSPDDQHRDRGEPSLIAGITHQVLGEFGVERGRVYVAGLSAGGAAAAVLGAAYPDLYAAVGVHSGLAPGAAKDLPSALTAMRRGGPAATSASNRDRKSDVALATIVFHGDRDVIVNPVNGDQVIAGAKAGAVLRNAEFQGQTPGGISFTQSVQTDGSGRAMLEQWVVHGAGHAWSGGGLGGSYTEPRGPDASREMIRFFFQHRVRDA